MMSDLLLIIGGILLGGTCIASLVSGFVGGPGVVVVVRWKEMIYFGIFAGCVIWLMFHKEL